MLFLLAHAQFYSFTFVGHEGELTKFHYVSKKYTILLRTLYGRIKPLNWRFVVVRDGDISRSAQISIVKSYHALGEAVKHKIHIGKKGKSEILVHSLFFPSCLVPYQLWKLLKCTQDFAAGLNHRGGIGSSKTKKIEQLKDNRDCLLLHLFLNCCV